MSNEQQHFQEQQQQQQQLSNLLSHSSNYGIALQASAVANDAAAAAAGIPTAAALGYESMPMSRRLSNFGLGGGGSGQQFGGVMDRRGSGLMMDDFLGRRASIGFDIGMDRLFDRRDSMDTTAAALEGAIMDFTRRRYSLLGGAGGASSSGLGDLTGLTGLAGATGLGGLFSSSAQHESSLSNMNAATGGSLVAAHHDRLLLQQRELEQRQTQLDEQRRLLLANIGTTMPNLMHMQTPLAAQLQQAQLFQESLAGYGSFNRNSLGLGTLPRGSLGLGGFNMNNMQFSTPLSPQQPPAATQKQWFVCQVCSYQSFNTKKELEAHEELCRQDAAAAQAAKFEDLQVRKKQVYKIPTEDASTAAEVADADAPVDQNPGPYDKLAYPIALALETDKEWLTPLHCFVRRNCIEVFTATKYDVAMPSKGKRKPIVVDQVGIRCPHCRHSNVDEDGKELQVKEVKESGSTYYPTSLSCIYNAAMNLLQRHLHACPFVPQTIMDQFNVLKQDDARSGTSKRYWIESAERLGLVDSCNGIRYCSDSMSKPDHQTRNTLHAAFGTSADDAAESQSGTETMSQCLTSLTTANNAHVGVLGGVPVLSPFEESVPRQAPSHDLFIKPSQTEVAREGPLVFPEDQPYATAFSYQLLGQMQPCGFTEADRLGKRKGLPHGYPGLACQHCFGGFGSGRFFPSSIKTLSDTSKTLNVLHNHMMRCRKCPAEIQELLESLRATHNEERAKMKFGSQKAFFGRIWRRLHGKDVSGEVKKKRKLDSGALSQHGTGMPAISNASVSATTALVYEDMEEAPKRHKI